MKPRTFPLLFVATVLTTTPLPVFSHHSVSAEFDASQRLTLAGTVTRVTWSNPHSFFYVDAKDPKTAAVVSWMCELGSPNMLLTLGWTRETLKIGMTVSFTGTPARDGSKKVIARNIVADGNRLIAWPSEQTKP
jgi:hypothetical protein